MYSAYYGLTGMPFQLTPDSRFFFGSTGHGRAMSHLVYGLSQEEGFIVVTGEVGAGKTTLVEHLWSQLDRSSYTIARVMTTQVSADDLLRLAAGAFGVEDAPDKATLLRRIEATLRSHRAEGRRALLVVDEVQGLTVGGLEELRMLSNVSQDGRPLLQTILLGQPEFRRTLGRPELNQLRQRVLASYHLGPLSPEETRSYIEHRLRAVGWSDRPVWEAEAFAEIHRATDGIPRRINRLCSRVMLYAALEESATITGEMVRDTAHELLADIGSETVSAAADPPDGRPQHELSQRVEALERAVGRQERLFRRLMGILGSLGDAKS
jgi:general secretion pathway protein A